MNVVTRDRLRHLINQMPEADMVAAERHLEFLAAEPVDERLSSALRESLQQSAEGKVTVCADFDEMVTKILGD
jgi:hypothetical protein